MGNPARPRGFKVGRRPTAASRKDHGGGCVRQPRGDHGPARAHLTPPAVPAPGLIPPASAPTTEAPAPGLIPPASAPTTEAPASGLIPPASAPTTKAPAPRLLPPASAPTTEAPVPVLLPPPSHAVPELALLPPPSPTTPAPGVPPPDWVPWYMAPASWYMTHERAHLTTPTATPPAPALLLPPTAPSTATSEPRNYNGMMSFTFTHLPIYCRYQRFDLFRGNTDSICSVQLLGPRVNVRDPSPPAAPATSITTPAFLPPPTANPIAMKKGILGWAASLDLKVMEEEPEGSKDSMGEDDEADLKAAWCYGA